ncbi:hypothetical protein CEAn_00414 [Coxiella endosymbiont of Amblyomma nuttalli]|nr:hypothetical protein CEAn_00414 [Coxiella endosymbiont of Amblyomma nuttalli]
MFVKTICKAIFPVLVRLKRLKLLETFGQVAPREVTPLLLILVHMLVQSGQLKKALTAHGKDLQERLLVIRIAKLRQQQHTYTYSCVHALGESFSS